jgi:lysozyme
VPAFSSLGQQPDQPSQPTASPAEREIRMSVVVLEPNYTVQAGDNLGAIAARHNTSLARIAALNNLADPRMLSIGQTLIIPPAP